EKIGVAVVAAVDLDELVATGEAAGEAHGGHGRLGTRVDGAHLVDGGQGGTDGLGELHLELGGRSERSASAQRLLDGFEDFGVSVAEHQGTPRADEIDKALAVDAVDEAAVAVGDEEWIDTHRAAGANR